GGNTYIVANGVQGFSLNQQAGQSGNTLDLSQYNADLTAQVHLQGGISVYLGEGLRADGTVNTLSTALVNHLDVQILIGAEGRTTLDYSSYQDHVTVNLNYQDEQTGLYDASGMAGVAQISHVIGARGNYQNAIVGTEGDNRISVAGSTSHNQI